ncbi:MAG TPA: ABC transporter ATP-binding protein [Clostridiales bacterium]|nr:ABC transporter ATP-binding protein [Clostridiales bacterium]
MQYLRTYLKRYRFEIFFGQSSKLVEAILELWIPLIMADLIDIGIQNGDKSYIWSKGLLMLLVSAIGLCTTLVCQILASKASIRFGTELRSDLFAHINRLSHADVDKFGAASLITRVTADINQLQNALAMLIRLVVRAPFLAVGAIVMAMILDLRLSLIFLIVAPLTSLIIYVVMGKTIPFYRNLQKKLDQIAKVSAENLSGVRVVRAFSETEREKARFQTAVDEHAALSIRVSRLSALLNPLTSIVMNLGILAVLWLGGIQVNTGRLTPGVIVAFVNYMLMILMQIVIVANLVILFTRAAAAASRVGEVLGTEPSVVGPTDANAEPDETAPAAEFVSVSFAYHKGGGKALSDLNLTLHRGETLGVFGATGSGKSTLAALLLRFYDATSGEVKVFGHPVQNYAPEALRRQIGIVPQGARLFTGTVRENLQWGKPDATDEEIWQALETAQAAEFVRRLPLGLDHVVEERGGNFSGGQRQRLTIARALVGQPDILILDDASSALDFATDAALRQAIHKNTPKHTAVIYISQRVGAIRHADRILVLDEGRAVGLGTHDELYENCSVYREICHSQLSPEQLNS